MLPSICAASWSFSGIAWAYQLSVMVGLAWPRRVYRLDVDAVRQQHRGLRVPQPVSVNCDDAEVHPTDKEKQAGIVGEDG